MTSPYDPSRKISQLERDVQSLQYATSSLDDVHEDLRRVRDDMEEADRALRYRLEELDEGLGQRQREIESVEEDVAEATEDLEQLARRVAWLERRSRVATGDQVVNLDARDAKIRSYILDIDAGRTAAARLVDQWERRSLTNLIGDFGQAVAAQDEAVGQILQATSILATTTPDDPGYGAAAHRYRTARVQVQAQSQRATQLQPRVGPARRRLREDEALKGELAVTIRAGESALHHLTTRLRTRITEAVAQTALLPVWFTTVFGPMPPAERTERWVDDATAVLVYRVTYNVDDPTLALGRLPDTATERQIEDRKEAEKHLRQ